MKENKELEKEMDCSDGLCETDSGNDTSGNGFSVEKSNKNKLIYVGDPMCSWCWGITNHLDRIKDAFADQLDYELLLGGLRPGGGEEWTHEFREMIKSHWEHVEKASGQPFDYGFFDKKEFDYDTEPPARAVRVIRDIAPEKEWDFYKSLQRMFYAENKDIHDLNVLGNLCQNMEIDSEKFEALFLSQGYKQLVYQDFMKVQQMGVRGFPAVILQKGEEYFAVTMGYSDYDSMKENIEKILA